MSKSDDDPNTGRASRALDFVLQTINAPRPRRLDREGLLTCLRAGQPVDEWRPHIEALYDEVSHEGIHDLVLYGVTSFEVLERAVHIWGVEHARTVPWIQEMAELTRFRDRLERQEQDTGGEGHVHPRHCKTAEETKP